MSVGKQSEFYKSKEWTDCRKAYLKSVGGLCEVCMKQGIYKPAIIVHHKEHITIDNLYNPEITLSFSNLQAVCRDCHAKAHMQLRRYKIDETGEVKMYGDQTYSNNSNL